MTDDGPRVVGAERVLTVLRELAQRSGGASLDELSQAVGGSKPTIHRALASLRKMGFARQDERGSYLLGDEFIRLAFANHEERPEYLRIQPALQALAHRFGETVHYAVLDGSSIVYRAKVDPAEGSVRLTSTIGGRNPVHSTACGKLLLSFALTSDDGVRAWARKAELVSRTPRTITDPDRFAAELALIRKRGYATEAEENETGISCLAVPVWLGSPTLPSGAVSVSALTYRTSLDSLVDAVAEIQEIVGTPR
ncbi:IclR family transcriptional regulator [Ruania alkalisoli]|uniref:IclR family transcriptional regulator n=1 Tax=Ruania alkalisoli TaxID=2779775 RepID=A0A7M1SVK0_9MICO|nr:IclR family transcriptional regulator [Ruania alkalisoli]QOR71616.1 IclR family transcriptional regulator [Ruania alkalisoli]